MRIVHAHDQCAIAKNICRIGAENREFWIRVPRFPEYSPAPNILSQLYSAGAELFARGLAGFLGATLHIHGGHLSAFCLRTKVPYILHLHGSEIREIDGEGRHILSATEDTLRAIVRAKAVVYSTPDLSPFIGPIRNDARWLPIPLDKSTVEAFGGKGEFADIFFPHVWSSAKGVSKVAELIHSLGPYPENTMKLRGLALGDFQDLAISLGFKLVPPTSRENHIKRMLRSKIVLGQGSGGVGATDLEALVHRANYVFFPMESNALEHYGLDTASQQSPTMEVTLDTVRSTLQGNYEIHLSHQKILSAHSDQNIYNLLNEIYEVA